MEHTESEQSTKGEAAHGSVQAQRVGIACVAGAGMLGTFLPWASMGGFASVEGTRGDGWVTLVILGIALVGTIVFNRRQPLSTGERLGVVVLGVLSSLASLYDFTRLHETPMVSVGAGLYLVVFASVIVTIIACAGRRALPMIVAAGAAGLIVFAGFVHVTYNGGLESMRLCGKTSWSLHNTFVDLDDFIGRRITEENASAVDALVRCQVLQVGHHDRSPATQDDQTDRAGPGPADPNIGHACEVPNAGEIGRTARGVCRDLADCTSPSVYYQGYCPGGANVICCIGGGS